MKKTVRSGGGGWTLLTEDEVEAAETLLRLPELHRKSELINRYSFTWGRKKKRSVPELSSEKMTAAEADKSPSTPLCFLPSGSGSDGGDRRKPPVTKVLKRKERDDLMEIYNRMHQEREILMKKIKAMRTIHQELSYENMELKARGQKINYPRNIEEIYIWNSPMKIRQQDYHQQSTMFAPATPQQPQQHCLQHLVVDPKNSKLVGVTKSNSNGGGRFGLFNQIDPRVKIQLETYEPLDQSKWLVMDNVIKSRNAAAARKRRMLRMKENKSSLLAFKSSRNCR